MKLRGNQKERVNRSTALLERIMWDGEGKGDEDGGDGGQHEAQIDVRLLKMKIAARDKREGGSRHGE